tara:strand:- start:980 stop:1201 length:222 start_codon:yes stop_codon:yes gene_type:complete
MKIYKKNLNTKWTSKINIRGWKHFKIINYFKKKQQVELYAICDKSIKIIINYKELTNLNLWSPGWKSIKIKEK